MIVDPADLAGISGEQADAAGKTQRNNLKVLRGYAERQPRPGNRRIVFRFHTSPIEIRGDDKVEEIVLGRNELVTDENGGVVAKDTGARETLPVQRVVHAVGNAASRHRGCRSTKRPARSRTPTAGSMEATMSTSSGGSSAARPA
ncbi:hypothetical protein [Mycobacterium paraintracellulare]|uniref:hypothetical protein n=1 Tax=Mycobacterium paraintracellulare TaxID=1138383 RepID=UPI0019285F8B